MDFLNTTGNVALDKEIELLRSRLSRVEKCCSDVSSRPAAQTITQITTTTPVTPIVTGALTRWVPLSNGYAIAPEIIFDAEGEVVVVEELID